MYNMIIMTSEIWHSVGKLAQQIYGSSRPDVIELLIRRLDDAQIFMHESIDNIDLRSFIIKRGAGYILTESKLMYHDPQTIIAVIIPRDEYNRRLSAEKEAELWPV